MFKRISVFVLGVVSYGIFLATFLYAIGFVGNIWVPKSIDSEATIPFLKALVIDALLLGVFAIQHSVMARPIFKRWLTQYIPAAAERSTYVLFSSLALIALFVYWEPIGGVIWQIDDPIGQFFMYSAFAFGWGLVLVSTFLIHHFDLFGLRQVWLQLVGKPYSPLPFKTPGPYNWVRHPLYVGWFFAFWATPTMTITHLVFALLTSMYILVAIQLEERDLFNAHPEYAGYRDRVPMLIPQFFRKVKPQPTVEKRT